MQRIPADLVGGSSAYRCVQAQVDVGERVEWGEPGRVEHPDRAGDGRGPAGVPQVWAQRAEAAVGVVHRDPDGAAVLPAGRPGLRRIRPRLWSQRSVTGCGVVGRPGLPITVQALNQVGIGRTGDLGQQLLVRLLAGERLGADDRPGFTEPGRQLTDRNQRQWGCRVRHPLDRDADGVVDATVLRDQQRCAAVGWLVCVAQVTAGHDSTVQPAEPGLRHRVDPGDEQRHRPAQRVTGVAHGQRRHEVAAAVEAGQPGPALQAGPCPGPERVPRAAVRTLPGAAAHPGSVGQDLESERPVGLQFIDADEPVGRHVDECVRLRDPGQTAVTDPGCLDPE